MGKQEFLVKKIIKKIQRNLIQLVKFVVICDTKKISYSLPKIPNSSCSNVVYEFTCPSGNSSYIGKTERNLATRSSELSDRQKNSISKHLSECEHANYILNLNHIFDNLNDSDTKQPDTPLSFHNLIQANTQPFHTQTHEFQSPILEALYIKYRKPVLNIGLRASKELKSFPKYSIVCQ